MYFKTRAEAGNLLAENIATAFGDKLLLARPACSVIALSEGGVVVGLQIAKKLECMLSMLLVESIELPGEIDPIGAISEGGAFAYNNMYAPGEIEELMFDYRGVVEDEKRVKLSRLHQLAGTDSTMRLDLLRHKHIILVSDGFSTGHALSIALEVLKPVAIKSLSAAAPIVSPAAVDRLRTLCDRTFYLSIAQNYLATSHYYDANDMPDRSAAIEAVQQFVRDQQKPQ